MGLHYGRKDNAEERSLSIPYFKAAIENFNIGGVQESDVKAIEEYLKTVEEGFPLLATFFPEIFRNPEIVTFEVPASEVVGQAEQE